MGEEGRFDALGDSRPVSGRSSEATRQLAIEAGTWKHAFEVVAPGGGGGGGRRAPGRKGGAAAGLHHSVAGLLGSPRCPVTLFVKPGRDQFEHARILVRVVLEERLVL